MSERAAPLLALLAAVLLAGCYDPRSTPTPPATAAAGGDQAVQDHLARLEEKIARLERGGGGVGRGAMREGSSLRVEGTGGETALERLRRLERERSELEARLKERDQRLAGLDRQLGEAREQGRTLGEKADYLGRVQDSLVAAQQTLAERQEENAGLKGQLGASELQRLRTEREYYLLAAAVLRLSPERPAELSEIQERLRDQAKDLVRDEGPGKGAAR